MHWILQDNIYNEEGFARLIDALTKMGIPHSIHKVIPFVHTLEPDINPKGKVVIMGSYTLSRIAQEKGWAPGTFLNDNFNFMTQKYHWGTKMLNHDSHVGYFANVPFQKDPFFIRPVSDGKQFAGTVVDYPEYLEWLLKVSKLTPEDGATLSPKTVVQTSPLKKIHTETRCWVVNFKVVTASEYKRGSVVKYSDQVDERVINFVEEQAAIWSPHGAYVMDVADTPDGLKIIEVNNLNSSGFYAADVQKLVHAIEEAYN